MILEKEAKNDGGECFVSRFFLSGLPIVGVVGTVEAVKTASF